MLEVGDKLPTVREVVAATAVNPNTAVKAYRELEHDGLVEPRAGHGTFVATPVRPAAGHAFTAGTQPRQWVGTAREAGLDDESIESLLRVTLRAVAEEETA